MGASIYAPSITYVMEEFSIELPAASLGMAIYVLGYGIGPLLWSPLSEYVLLSVSSIVNRTEQHNL
jgi:DHA1 family multidrug resistance protein-like MFS transporter